MTLSVEWLLKVLRSQPIPVILPELRAFSMFAASYEVTMFNAHTPTAGGRGVSVVELSGNVRRSDERFAESCSVTFIDRHGSVNWKSYCECGHLRCEHIYGLLVHAGKMTSPSVVPSAMVEWARTIGSYRAQGVPGIDVIPDLIVGLLLVADGADPLGKRPVRLETMLLAQPVGEGSRKPAMVSRTSFGWMDRLLPGEAAKLSLIEMTASRHPSYDEDIDDGRFSNSAFIAEQEDVFVSILQRGGVYRDRFVGKPLLQGPEVKPTADWSLTGEYRQHLRLMLPDQSEVQKVLRLNSLWYLQDDTMGRLVGDPEFLSLILAAPPLDEKQIPEVVKFWSHQPFAKSLPAPVDTTAARVITALPIGILTLSQHHVTMDAGQEPLPVPVAQLSYEYDGQMVPHRRSDRSAVIVRRTDDGVLKIHPNPEEEDELHFALFRANLEAATNHPDLTGKLPSIDMVFVNSRYQAAASDLDHFLRAVDRCEANGYKIVLATDFPYMDVDDVLTYTAMTASTSANAEPSRWFDIEMGIEIGGERHNLGAVVSAALNDPLFTFAPQEKEPQHARWTITLGDGQRIRMPLSELRKLIAPIAEWMDGNTQLKDGRLRLGKLLAATFAANIDGDVPRSLALVRDNILRMREIAMAPVPRQPKDFVGKLRPYQREGLRWLNALAEASLGGILADDMGLGKTPQVLAHILHRKNSGKLLSPVLVVVPRSLVANWASEACKFTPTLRVLILHGQDRAARYKAISDSDLVITTYNVLPRDIRLLDGIHFSLIVADESEAIKNPTALASKAIRRVYTDSCICLNGTPVENRLLELWNQMDLTMPGLLGEQREFKRLYITPIEKHGDDDKLSRLNRRIRPFILRRTKEEVASDLPPKTENTITIELEGEQRRLYESLRAAMNEQVQQAIADRGLRRCGTVMLEAILKLRQTCCDPRLVKLQSAKDVKGSAKLDALLEMLCVANSEGRRVLVFSAFTSMLDLIATELVKADIKHLILTGKTQKRAEMVEQFQQGSIPVFLLSLKAGGRGLNLTAADTVIHYDPWWNPAAENQATDRAHRIGQTKPIMVYRLICANSMETKIEELKARKSDLAQSILDNSAAALANLTVEDIANLFAKD